MMKIIYAGNREISVKVLEHIIGQGCLPCALMTTSEGPDSSSSELIELCKHLKSTHILQGNMFRTKEGLNVLKELKPDYIICVHFPYIISKEVLEIPNEGVLNLHPAFLPYNRGWNTPSWAIWEDTLYGATLHFMDEGLDTGDILSQKKIDVLPDDTADKLYKRILELEYELFKEAWPSIFNKRYSRKTQTIDSGTFHKKGDIMDINHLDLESNMKVGKLVKLLRALTTNHSKEAAYFIQNNRKYRIHVNIWEEK